MEIGKVPPQSVDTEEVVLGALLLEKPAIKKVAGILTTESFYNDSHSKIYNAIFNLHEKGTVIDLMTVTNELQKSNDLEYIGSSIKLAQLMDRVAGAGNIEDHAYILKDKHIRREAISKARELEQLAYREDIDTADILSKNSQNTEEILKMAVSEKKSANVEDIVKQTLNNYEQRIKNKEANIANGVPTGFKGIDDMTYGLQNSDFVIWAGRPSQGKTASVLFSMRYQAEKKIKPAIFSIEMSATDLVDRMIIADEKVDVDAYKTGSRLHMDAVERSAGRVAKYNMFIDDETYNINDICIRAMALKEEHDIDIVYIDYIGLIESNMTSNMNRENQVSQISRRLKKLAKELNVPVVGLAQLNRNLSNRSDKRPQLSDLRDSGSLEQDADMVVFIHRDEYYGVPDTEREVDIILAKHRKGAIGDVKVKRNHTHTNYKEIDPIDEITGGNHEIENSIPSPFPDGVG